MTTGRYAEKTDVSVERSRGEIERLLDRAGADQFLYAREEGRAVIAFRLGGRHIRMTLPLPAKDDERFTVTPSGRWQRTEKAAREAWEQAVRQAWRQLALIIRAKLEAVAAEITTIEREFLADVLLPNGQTISEWSGPQIDIAYAAGTMPALLPEGRG